MDDGRATELAFRCHRVLDPLHSLSYFAPETEQYLTGAGLRPGRMCYFAGRSAPFGAVGPGTVTATFFNFSPDLIAKHIPRAWTLASPQQVVEARFEAADAALRRLLGEDTIGSPELAEAADLAREATEGCTADGRPLYAAHAELDWPDEPHLVLWHAISLLREFRGDGHIAALVTHGLTGLPALITHTATGKGFLPESAKATRGWSDEQWDAAAAKLREDGVLDETGTALTDEGKALRERIEADTNAAATGPWRRLGEDRAVRLHDLAREFSRSAVAAGAFPEGVFAAPKA